MPVSPLPIRLEKELLDLLSDGARRTPHKKQELIRLTLRRHLSKVIEDEATPAALGRVTTIEPWPKGTLADAYKAIQHERWDEIEEVAVTAQGMPGMDD